MYENPPTNSIDVKFDLDEVERWYDTVGAFCPKFISLTSALTKRTVFRKNLKYGRL